MAPAQASPRPPASTGSGAGPRYRGLALGGPTRVAVVGAGYIAEYHLAILSRLEGVVVGAVCDPDLARARALAARFQVPAAVGGVRELPALGIDVAHVLVPPDLHVSLAQELLGLSIGVFLEKPAALCADELRALQAEADRRGLPLGVNHNNLFHPSFVRLAERAERGEIGRVEHLRVCLSVPLMQLDAGQYSHWMFRAPRNIVFEQAVHPLCQVHRLIGRVERATTTILSSRELHPGQIFHDRWLCAARGERGTAEVYLAFGQGFTRSTIEVLGSDGSLEADLWHDHFALERKTVWLDFWNSFLAGWRRGRMLRWSALRVLWNWSRFTLGLGPRRDAFYVGMRASAAAFHERLRRREALAVDGARAAEVLDWCAALAGDVSGAETPAPNVPAPGPARPGEVVVLGAAGFIGRRVVAKLVAAGVPLTCVVRRRRDLPPEVVSAAASGAARLVVARLEDGESLRAAVRGARAVLHLATGGGDTWEAVERSMVDGTRALGEACIAEGVTRLVYVSSVAALYTAPSDEGATLGDDTPTDPRAEERAIYSRGKIAAERALLELRARKGLRVCIARPAIVVGAGTPLQHSGFGLWARDNHCVGWGNGEHKLPLVWVDDVADALVAACRHEGDALDGKAFQLAARVDLNAREVVDELRRSSGRALHFHPRSLAFSQVLEVGKWLVKKAGRRPGAQFPSWRDLRARALDVEFPCTTARELLGWRPLEEREAFLDAAIRVYAPRPSAGGDPAAGPA